MRVLRRKRGKRLAETMGKIFPRVERRTDLVENFPPGDQGKTTDIVAKKIGIGSGGLEHVENFPYLVQNLDNIVAIGFVDTNLLPKISAIKMPSKQLKGLKVLKRKRGKKDLSDKTLLRQNFAEPSDKGNSLMQNFA